MTLPPLWPAALPLCANARGAAGTAQEHRHRFAPEQGLPIQRPMQTAAILNYTLSFSGLSGPQMNDLWEFHDVTLSHGTLKFGWVHPRRHIPRAVTFSSAPQENRLAADRWSASLAISFVDVDPAWAGDVTLANGMMEAV